MPRTTASPALPPGFSLPRSVALATAITLHLALAAAMWMPLETPGRAVDDEVRTPVVLELERPSPPILPPPPSRPTPVLRRDVPTPRPEPLPPPTAAATEALPGPAVDTASPLDLPADAGDAGAGDLEPGPALAVLQLREGTAPRYPAAALARRMEGEVELLILVGIDGRPESVSVARSSGHALLDRTAREHVLRRWVFEPAQRNGIAVTAWARVPVRFRLPR